MNRLVITKIEHHKKKYIAYILMDESRNIQELQVFEPEEQTLLNHIYVGYVEKIVPNIQAAFVRIAGGQKCYLPLDEVKAPLFAKKQSEKKMFCEGDELLVQVIKDAVKTKDPVVSTGLTLHGHYCFLTTANIRLGVSQKINKERAAELLSLAEQICPLHEQEGYGMVFRTNAESVPFPELEQDVLEVQKQYEELKNTGIHKMQGSLLYRSLPGYLTRLKAEDYTEIDCIYTDGPELYQEISAYLPALKEKGILQLYTDPAVSLATLYHLRGNMEKLLSSRVWLDSGANIIIETLETLTVIDVNSGKNQSRKPETLFAVNVEAAKEIARQLRLRNISGMIIIDFINMKNKQQQDKLLQVIRSELKKDYVPARFVDITKLGLVELTRKKVYKSLREVLK